MDPVVVGRLTPDAWQKYRAVRLAAEEGFAEVRLWVAGGNHVAERLFISNAASAGAGRSNRRSPTSRRDWSSRWSGDRCREFRTHRHWGHRKQMAVTINIGWAPWPHS
jgi:hypothetical protein